MLILADSMGFAGTHSISEILSSLPDTYVCHGSQNFISKTQMGTHDQSPEDYADAMLKISTSYKNTIGIHANFSPTRMKDICENKRIKYAVIVRHPEKQINSCYNWAVKKCLDDCNHPIFENNKQNFQSFSHLLKPTLANYIYTYAIKHVFSMNIPAINAGAKLLKMEDLLTSEFLFKSAFGINPEVELSNFNEENKHIVSHVNSAADFKIGSPDTSLIHSMLAVKIKGIECNWGKIKLHLGYQTNT